MCQNRSLCTKLIDEVKQTETHFVLKKMLQGEALQLLISLFLYEGDYLFC